MTHDLELAQLTEADALFEQLRPLFAGRSPQVVGLVLVELTALWLAGHPLPPQDPDADKLRAEMMRHYTVATLELIPVMQAQFVRQ